MANENIVTTNIVHYHHLYIPYILLITYLILVYDKFLFLYSSTLFNI